jgi:hypothetical protein
MKNPEDLYSFKPGPIVFPMHALQYLETKDINAAQQKAIAILFLKYCKNCAQEEMKLAEGMISVIENLESKG